MTPYLKAQYNQYLVEYLEHLTDIDIKIKNDKIPFGCPICNKAESALIYPNNKTKFYCLNPECNFKGDIFDLVRKIKNPKFKDEDIADYLIHKFKIEIKDNIDDLLKLYSKNKFTLFPLESNSKNPQKGFMWTEKLYIDPQIWKDWIDRGYGLALRLGKVSHTIAIDIDDDKTYEKMKDLLEEDTLIQETKRGKHWVFQYDSDFDKVMHVNFRPKGYEMEMRANNAYIAIAPTSAEGEIRRWNNKKIQKMPKKLKEFFLDLIDKDTKNVEDDIQDAIDNEKIDVVDLSGQRNDTFVKTLGIFSKWMPKDTAHKVMNFLSNNWIDKPIPRKELNGMMRQIEKYRTYDKKELADEVLKRLEIIKEGTAFQIAGTLKREQKDIEDVLKYLDDNNKVISLSGRKYQVLQDVEWTTDKSDMSVPVDFRVPYFHDYNHFDWGNMIIIGGASGVGKTHITGNIIKQLTDQNIKPYLITTEAGSKIGKITHKLGIPDEMYYVPKKAVKHPMDIELKDNVITVIDWLKVKDGDYAKTDMTYEHFHNQLKLHGGFLFILTQLRKSNNEFMAMDQVEYYGACVAKYLFGNNGQDSENTLFQTQKLRDSKTGQQYITIPTYFDKDTKILEIRK
jgi:hypothetical protein